MAKRKKKFRVVRGKYHESGKPLPKEHVSYAKAERKAVGTRTMSVLVPCKKTLANGMKDVKYVEVDVPVYATSKPDGGVIIDRCHKGNADICERVVSTPYFKGKNGAAKPKVRKNPKAKFTWQERIDIRTKAAFDARSEQLSNKSIRKSRVSLSPEEKTLRKRKSIALKRSLAAFAVKDARLAGKAAHRANVAYLLARKADHERKSAVLAKLDQAA